MAEPPRKVGRAIKANQKKPVDMSEFEFDVLVSYRLVPRSWIDKELRAMKEWEASMTFLQEARPRSGFERNGERLVFVAPECPKGDELLRYFVTTKNIVPVVFPTSEAFRDLETFPEFVSFSEGPSSAASGNVVSPLSPGVPAPMSPLLRLPEIAHLLYGARCKRETQTEEQSVMWF